MTPEEIKKLLDVDPLGDAEVLTGKSYKDDQDTSDIGMFLHFEKNKIVQDLMVKTNDTHHGSSFIDALKIINELGFIEVWEETFIKEKYNHSDEYKIFIHEELGILLVIESFNLSSVNKLEIYYNWSENKNRDHSLMGLTYSGSYAHKNEKLVLLDENNNEIEYNLPEEPIWTNEPFSEFRELYDKSDYKIKYDDLKQKYNWVWCGHHDCREGLRNKIELLNKYGKLLNKWIKPYLVIHLNNYSEEFGTIKDGVYLNKTVNFTDQMKGNLNL